MTVLARVRVWHDDDGWGVLDSDETPGGCWAHFSALKDDGYRTARAGDAVLLEWKTPGQDGYRYRAVRIWPTGGIEQVTDHESVPASSAYRSELGITLNRTRGS